MVPDSALVIVGDSLAVFVVGQDSIAHARSVTVGMRRNGLAEILRGLTAGEVVVISGAFGLNDGTRVVSAASPKP
jgi:membrane fusion protein (multidrug efflux system)